MPNKIEFSPRIPQSDGEISHEMMHLAMFFLVVISLSLFTISSAGDPRAELIQSFVKLQTAYPYRLTEIGSVAGMNNGQPGKRVLEMAGPEDFHLKWTSGTIDMESISINGKSYYKLKGNWVATQGSKAEESSPTNLDMNEVVKAIKDVKTIGPENLNGVACTKYSFRFNPAEMSIEGDGTAWVGADGLPRKADLNLNASGMQVKSSLVYEYDKNIRIVAPAMN
ncbi:MAG TPA: hypothetical protein VLH08_14195 [Acidobacteriota bacterium]|nr:hypothetical protein [Acidobacteriota bacterium]